METPQIESVGFYQTLQSSADQYLSYVHLNSKSLICYISVFGVGMLAGMFFKRYGLPLIAWLVSVIFLLALLQYLNLVIISIPNIKTLLCLEHIHSLDEFIVEMKAQFNRYFVECIVFAIAFLFGNKLG